MSLVEAQSVGGQFIGGQSAGGNAMGSHVLAELSQMSDSVQSG